MAEREIDGLFTTTRRLKPGAVIVIGRHAIELIAGHGVELRITAANGEHVRFKRNRPAADQLTDDPKT